VSLIPMSPMQAARGRVPRRPDVLERCLSRLETPPYLRCQMGG